MLFGSNESVLFIEVSLIPLCMCIMHILMTSMYTSTVVTSLIDHMHTQDYTNERLHAVRVKILTTGSVQFEV